MVECPTSNARNSMYSHYIDMHGETTSKRAGWQSTNTMAEDTEDDQEILDFDLPLPMGPATNLFAPHETLRRILDLDSSDTVLTTIFRMLTGLCDPLTQPEDDERLSLSVEVLGEVAIALAYQILLEERDKGDTVQTQCLKNAEADVACLRFTISVKFFSILESINAFIRADDELRVRYLKVDYNEWEQTASQWLPDLSNLRLHDPDASLKLLYYVSCVIIMGIFKLFKFGSGQTYSAALNPYSEYFLRLWKTHTRIIAIALEMDRQLEEEAWSNEGEGPETPDVVKMVLLGCSAVRTVLAWVIEQVSPNIASITKKKHQINQDVCELPLLLFFDPLARSAKNCGSIVADERLLMLATLVIRSRNSVTPKPYYLPTDVTDYPYYFDCDMFSTRIEERRSTLGSAGDLLTDLFYADRFDEDVKYVFGYYESDEEEADNDSAFAHESTNFINRLHADDIDYDEDGTDWRDLVRGENGEFSEQFLELESKEAQSGKSSDYFFSSMFELEQAFIFLASVKIESVVAFVERIGQVTINTVAKAIKDDAEGKESNITPKQIYKYLTEFISTELFERVNEELPLSEACYPTNLELILLRNPQCCLALVDELLMFEGMRRSMIWVLIRSFSPSMTLINYFYELVTGTRGNSDKRETKYKFSRNGPLELSEVERSMALHELFLNANEWCGGMADSTTADSLAVNLMKCLCLMIDRLISDGIIKTHYRNYLDAYSFEIDVLIIPWIGRLKEARDLYYKVKSMSFRRINDEKQTTETSQDKRDIASILERLENVGYSEYYAELSEPAVESAVREFGERLFCHICNDYGITIPESIEIESLGPAEETYSLFITKFNVFTRNENFVKHIFALFRKVSIGIESIDSRRSSVHSEVTEATPEGLISTVAAESEFNDAFLNGEGQFHDEKKRKESEKKKKKKKKRGKRK